VTSVAWQRPATEAIRGLGTLAGPDYTDVFTASPIEARARPPEEWTREILEGTPALRRLIPVLHRLVLGLRLGPLSSPDYILGWKIADRGEDYIRLETSSWMMTPHLLFKFDADRISVGSLIRYERWLARCIWPPVSILHRRVGIALLRHAVRPYESDGS
jgi:hypothetical protein